MQPAMQPTVVPTTQRAAILRRVSTEEQRQGWSLRSQPVDALTYCHEQNYAVVADVEEVDSGDLLDEREGLWHIRELAKHGLIDVVVVGDWADSRAMSRTNRCFSTSLEWWLLVSGHMAHQCASKA